MGIGLQCPLPAPSQNSLSFGLGRGQGCDAGEGSRLCSMALNRMWWHPLTVSVLFEG